MVVQSFGILVAGCLCRVQPTGWFTGEAEEAEEAGAETGRFWRRSQARKPLLVRHLAPCGGSRLPQGTQEATRPERTLRTYRISALLFWTDENSGVVCRALIAVGFRFRVACAGFNRLDGLQEGTEVAQAGDGGAADGEPVEDNLCDEGPLGHA